MAARQCVNLNLKLDRWLSAGFNFSIFARLFRLSKQSSNTRIHSQFSHSSYLRCERRKLKETSRSGSSGSTNTDSEQDNNPEDSPKGTADTSTNLNCKVKPGIELSMTSTSSLKITVPDKEAVEGKFRDVKEPAFVYYHKINFSSVDKKLASNKVVPLLLRWLPRSLKRQFFSSVLTDAKKKAYLDEDFDEQEFYHYGGLVRPISCCM